MKITNIWYTMKSGLRGKSMALCVYMKNVKRCHIRQIRRKISHENLRTKRTNYTQKVVDGNK